MRIGKPSPRVNADFVLLAMAAAVATAMDVESTVRAQRDPEAVEVNSWIYGERPGRARMYGVNLPLVAAFAYMAYGLKKNGAPGPNSRLWRAPLLMLTLGHTAAAVVNLIKFG
jgi:hypothetical protein